MAVARACLKMSDVFSGEAWTGEKPGFASRNVASQRSPSALHSPRILTRTKKAFHDLPGRLNSVHENVLSLVDDHQELIHIVPNAKWRVFRLVKK